MKIQEIVQNKAEKAALKRKTLRTNQIKKEFDRLAEQINLRIQKHIKYSDVK